MLLQFGHVSSFIKLYNLENNYVSCTTEYGTFIGAVIERLDQNKDAHIKFMKQNHVVSTWPQNLQNECLVLSQSLILG